MTDTNPSQDKEKNMKIINLTPHAINLIGPDGFVHPVPASGTIARARVTSSKESSMRENAPVPVKEFTTFGVVDGLPAPSSGTIYIVSLITLWSCEGRDDVFAPATGPNDEVVRNSSGQIVGVRYLIAAPGTEGEQE